MRHGLGRLGLPRPCQPACQPLEPKPTAALRERGPRFQPCCPQPVTALSGGPAGSGWAIARLLRQEPALLLGDEPWPSSIPRLAVGSLLALLCAVSTGSRALLLKALHALISPVIFDRLTCALRRRGISCMYARTECCDYSNNS